MQGKDKGSRELQKSGSDFDAVFFTNLFYNTMSILNISLYNLASQDISATMTTQVMCSKCMNRYSH